MQKDCGAARCFVAGCVTVAQHTATRGKVDRGTGPVGVRLRSLNVVKFDIIACPEHAQNTNELETLEVTLQALVEWYLPCRYRFKDTETPSMHGRENP